MAEVDPAGMLKTLPDADCPLVPVVFTEYVFPVDVGVGPEVQVLGKPPE